MTGDYALLCIGGGPAGLSAARAYRETDGAGRVGILTDESRMPYRRPPLTKELIRGEACEDELPLEDEAWLEEQRVELIAGRAVRLDTGAHRVVLSGGRELAYRSCVLATGAEPKRLPVPGADHPRVHVVRSVDHVRELDRRLGRSATVAVIGSGFIGCELASSLRIRGHAVTLIGRERKPNVERLGEEGAGAIASWLEADGVELHLGQPVEEIEHHGNRCVIRSGEGESGGGGRVAAEVVVMAAGVSPRTELAEAAGLELVDDAIPTDERMRTAREGVLAAGDVCLARHAAAGRPLRVEHWGDALGQGEVAGRTAAGAGSARWDAVPGFWSTIGRRTLKYAAWGDGFDQTSTDRLRDGAFATWYGSGGRIVGVLTHQADEQYERGRRLIAEDAPWR